MEAVRQEIEQRGGRVSSGTVSKVLKILEEDLIVRRDGAATRLVQPTELLHKLADNLQRPTVTFSQTFKWMRGGDARCLVAGKAAEGNIDLVATGSSSTGLHSTAPEESVTRFYCRDIRKLLDAAGKHLQPATRFADVELIEADDPLRTSRILASATSARSSAGSDCGSATSDTKTCRTDRAAHPDRPGSPGDPGMRMDAPTDSLVDLMLKLKGRIEPLTLGGGFGKLLRVRPVGSAELHAYLTPETIAADGGALVLPVKGAGCWESRSRWRCACPARRPRSL